MAGDVIVEVTGSLGRIRLNRPQAINALTHAMVHEIDHALDRFATDPTVRVVLLTGEGERGLCAGGDIRSLYEAPRVTDGPSMDFWRDEYRLDARIARFEKPFVAVMDGLVMGGGVGISAHARFRLVTEKSRIAMPEVGIGFVPDVGGTAILSQAPGEIGTYYALTGRVMNAAEAILAGMADLCLPLARLPDLVAPLAGLPKDASFAEVDAVLQSLAIPPGPAPVTEHRDLIDRAFSANRVEDVLAALGEDGSPFARETAAEIAAKSPTALKLALALLRAARKAPGLEAALERDFAAARALVVGPDFYEGIRAAIIDKDRAPKWRPATLAEVGEADMARWLEPTGDRVFPALELTGE
ncbi:enoyl-CoA hydratase/isomerase family protein [Frigidibacter sp. RF13]|uniref:enoyl-CoA hydratase/isomerase family protein n=1 Tax=Frigidibacter sp. RF13 TaxID=2997340 RepID=UPI0022716DCF|nr:enoyl-CoA hydratase/isomerase family protein [Frigidibacter sp. RF13]MCY1127524.1 enoyl-CoA hydratase/isomerase family protein [Frigidibacter sp. RF13]